MYTGSPGTIVAGVIAATGLTVLNNLLQGKKSFHPIIGGFVTGTILLMIAFFDVPIASGLSLLLLITSIFVNGMPVLQKVMGK